MENINTELSATRTETFHGLDTVKFQVSSLKTETSRQFSLISRQIGALRATSSNVPSQLQQIAAATDILGNLDQQLGALRQRNSDLERTIRERSDVTQSELRALRDSVLSTITARDNRLPASDAALAVCLTDASIQDLSKRVISSLLSTPSALHDSCQATEITSLYSSLRRERLHSGPATCGCQGQRRAKTICHGRFSAQYDDIQSHQQSCPLFRAAGRSRRYSLRISLYPLIRKAAEISFTGTYQGGGFAISPALKVIGIVERSQSPIFQLFDSLRGQSHRIRLVYCTFPGAGHWCFHSVAEPHNWRGHCNSTDTPRRVGETI